MRFIRNDFADKVKKYRRIFLDRIEEELDSIVLSNECWQTLKIFKQTVPYLLIESSDRNYTEKCNEIAIDEGEKKFSIKMNTKMRKNNNNKKNQGDKADDQSVGVFSNQESVSLPARSQVLNKLNVEGGETFSFKIIFDPTWKYLVKFRIFESEEVLLAQFTKAAQHRKEFTVLLDLVDSIDAVFSEGLAS